MRSSQILVEAFELSGAGDRDDPWLLSEKPRDRNLGWRRFLARRDALEQIDKRLLATIASGVKRGNQLRTSEFSNDWPALTFPVRNP